MGGKSKAPAAPNYQPIATADEQAAQLQAQTANQQMAWAQQQFASNQNEEAPLIASETQAAQSQNQQAQASYNRYTNTEIPLQNQYLSEAEQYNNPAYAQQQAGTAVANTDQAYTGARNNAVQQQQMYGSDPGTGRSAAINAELGPQEAASKAAAATTSTQNTRLTGLDLQSNAENMMAGLPGQSTQEYGGANSSGSTASGNALGLTQSGASTMGTAAQYEGLEGNSLNSWGNTLSSSYDAQLSRNEYDSSLAEAQANEVGQAFGDITGMLAKGGVVRQRLAHGGMAIPDNASFAKGGILGKLLGKIDGSGNNSNSSTAAHQGNDPAADPSMAGSGTIVGNYINNKFGGGDPNGTIVGNAINNRYDVNTADGMMPGGFGAPGQGQAPGQINNPTANLGVGIGQPIPTIPMAQPGPGWTPGATYARGGPVIPRGVGKVESFKPGKVGVKNLFKPHLMTNSHPHTASRAIGVGAGGTPRASAGIGMRGLAGGGGGGGAFVTPGATKDGGVPNNIDSKTGGLPGGSGMGGGLGSSGSGGGGGGGLQLAEGGAIPASKDDPYGRADNIPVQAKAGSYVVPKSVVQKLGTHHLDKIVAQHGDHADKQAAHLRLQGVPSRDATVGDPHGNASIQMSAGEYMMPKSVVDKLGTHHFDKLVAQHGDATDKKAAELRLMGQQAGAGNGPPIPPNQLAAANPRVKLGAIPTGAS